MEHLLILLVEFARWLDRLFLKSLARAVPDLERLREDPRGTLASQTIVIRPARKYGSGLLLGALLGLGADLVVFLIFVLLIGRRNLPLPRHPELLALLMGLLVVVFLLSCWLVLRLLRGGRMVLTSAGVDLTYRQTTVFCPWALFHAAGQPFAPQRDLMLVPIAPAALHLVEARENDLLKSRGGAVKTKQLHFRSHTEAVLRPLYEVRLPELGGLLLQLGRALGTDEPTRLAPPAAAPVPRWERVTPAVVDRDGWLTVRLTRLVFPPFCCDCGAATEQMQEFRGFASLLWFGRFKVSGGQFATFQVPVCPECQKQNRRRSARDILRGLGLGVGIPFVILAGLALFFNQARQFLFLPILGGIIGLLIGLGRGRKRVRPVQLDWYAPDKGTIAIRFRWAEYGERLLAFLEAQEEWSGDAYPEKITAGS